MNYFIEGIQGSGKTTMLEKMTQDNPKLKAYREGDFSPVELAWCAYVSHSQYEIIIKKYANLAVVSLQVGRTDRGILGMYGSIFIR